MNRHFHGLRTGRVGTMLLGASCIAAVLLCACGESTEPTPQPRVLTEHSFLSAGGAKKQLGEDCTVAGGSECLSGLCFKYRPRLGEGYVCSRGCATDEDCPSLWGCLPIHPTPDSLFCAPPQDWVPRAINARNGTIWVAPAADSGR